MTDVNRLLRTYIERFESGGDVDPSDLVAKVEGRDRAELSALIEGYLEHAAPRQEWDVKAFQGSVAEQAVAMLEESWAAESAHLPRELVSLRNKAKLRRSELVGRLAEALGVGKQEEKVAVYYNALEHGRLEPTGVSAKVFEALAGLLGTTAEALRKAGESVAPTAGGEPGPAYARLTTTAYDADEPIHERLPDRAEEKADGGWDEVDRLFRGGD